MVRESLVSILLPVRDAAATLGPCLRSVLRQSNTRWECVVVDDGSRDSSVDVARGFAARDGRIRVESKERRELVDTLKPVCAA